MALRAISLLIPLMLLLASCATTIPEVSLSKASHMKMELNREAFGVTAMAVSRDGRYLMTGDNGGSTGGGGTPSLRLWDLTAGKQVLYLKDLSGTVTAIDISPDGRYAVTGGIALPGLSDSPKHALSVWDLGTGRLFKTFESHEGGHEITSVSFSRDGRRFLITTLADGKPQRTDIRIFDAGTWSLVKVLSPPKEPGYSDYLVAAFSPDGRFILSGGPASVVRLWDVETGREIKTFHGHKKSRWGGINSVAFSPDGKYALTSGWYDAHARLWDMESGKQVRTLFSSLEIDPWYKANVLGVTVSPDWKYAFIFGFKSRVRDIQTGEPLTGFSHAWKGLKTISGKHGGWPATARYHPGGRHILMTMTDAAVRIYDAKTGEETAMMVGFDDGEWLVITSEGYYNSSESGARYLGVRVGDKGYSVDMFYDVFYRPDIVTAKLKGEDIKDLITIIMEDAIKSPPPEVYINPIHAAAGPKAKVCYRVKSAGGGIGEVRLFHNGKLIESDGFYREASGTREKTRLTAVTSETIYEEMRGVKIKKTGETSPVASRPKGGEVEDCKEVDAVPGENEIGITAFNSGNTVQSPVRTIRFSSQIKEEDPHLYILSIGIDRYRDEAADLRYARKDALDIKERLMKQAETLYKPRNIHHSSLTDKEATKTNIIGKINELSGRIKPGDGFVLFVAAHGALLESQYYMLTHDYDGTIDEANSIGSNEIVEFSKKIRSLSQLFVFDTCHAGGVDYIISGLYDARMSVLAKKMGLHIYASASSMQEALDGYQGNGLFTHALLRGIDNNSAADTNTDSLVSMAELGEYSRKTTDEISGRLGHKQTPLIINFGFDAPVYKLR